MMLSQIAKQYKDVKFSFKLASKLLIFVLFFYLIFFATQLLKKGHYFPIKEVTVTGAIYSNHQEIEKNLKPLVKKGFFVVDVVEIKMRLMQLPWIANATVQRVWPGQIVIHLAEKNTLARWNENALLSTTGEIFNPDKSTYPPNLPLFIGPTGEQMQMLNYYDLIDDLLRSLHLHIVRLELMPTQSWRLSLDNGIQLRLGDRDILTRINHFVKVYSKIVGNRASEVEYIDLRYPNGLAVRWKHNTLLS